LKKIAQNGSARLIFRGKSVKIKNIISGDAAFSRSTVVVSLSPIVPH